jgi:hypothetical protein
MMVISGSACFGEKRRAAFLTQTLRAALSLSFMRRLLQTTIFPFTTRPVQEVDARSFFVRSETDLPVSIPPSTKCAATEVIYMRNSSRLKALMSRCIRLVLVRYHTGVAVHLFHSVYHLTR